MIYCIGSIQIDIVVFDINLQFATSRDTDMVVNGLVHDQLQRCIGSNAGYDIEFECFARAGCSATHAGGCSSAYSGRVALRGTITEGDEAFA